MFNIYKQSILKLFLAKTFSIEKSVYAWISENLEKKQLILIDELKL